MELGKQFSDKALQDFKLIDSAVEEQDQQAYASLMQRYKKPVYHMILKMVRNVDDAEDLTIEAFAKAFKNLHKFKKDYTFSTWLFRIATNNAIDFIRKKRLNTMSLNTSFNDDVAWLEILRCSDDIPNVVLGGIMEFFLGRCAGGTIHDK